MKRIICIILFAVIIVNSCSLIYAGNYEYINKDTENFITNTDSKIDAADGTQLGTIKNNIWGSVKLVLQIAALSALLFAGVRYMFASADQKADIKNSLVGIVIGSIIVFGTTLVTDFAISIAGEVLK